MAVDVVEVGVGDRGARGKMNRERPRRMIRVHVAHRVFVVRGGDPRRRLAGHLEALDRRGAEVLVDDLDRRVLRLPGVDRRLLADGRARESQVVARRRADGHPAVRGVVEGSCRLGRRRRRCTAPRPSRGRRRSGRRRGRSRRTWIRWSMFCGWATSWYGIGKSPVVALTAERWPRRQLPPSHVPGLPSPPFRPEP